MSYYKKQRIVVYGILDLIFGGLSVLLLVMLPTLHDVFKFMLVFASGSFSQLIGMTICRIWEDEGQKVI